MFSACNINKFYLIPKQLRKAHFQAQTDLNYRAWFYVIISDTKKCISIFSTVPWFSLNSVCFVFWRKTNRLLNNGKKLFPHIYNRCSTFSLRFAYCICMLPRNCHAAGQNDSYLNKWKFGLKLDFLIAARSFLCPAGNLGPVNLFGMWTAYKVANCKRETR